MDSFDSFALPAEFFTESSEADDIHVKFDSFSRSPDNLDCGSQPLELQLALVSKHHSLWAEYVYNAARVLAGKIDSKDINCSGKKCLELGAGAGLPGLLAALGGAKEVVISDYGNKEDPSLVYAIDLNIKSILPFLSSETVLYGVPYIFGMNPDVILDPRSFQSSCSKKLPPLDDYLTYKEHVVADMVKIENEKEKATKVVKTKKDKFDCIFLADLLFNRSEHRKLLWTVKNTLKPVSGICYVTFSHHDPQKSEKDLNFFKLAEDEFDFKVSFVEKEIRKSYPFVESDGLDEQRGIVYFYTLKIPN